MHDPWDSRDLYSLALLRSYYVGWYVQTSTKFALPQRESFPVLDQQLERLNMQTLCDVVQSTD